MLTKKSTFIFYLALSVKTCDIYTYPNAQEEMFLPYLTYFDLILEIICTYSFSMFY